MTEQKSMVERLLAKAAKRKEEQARGEAPSDAGINPPEEETTEPAPVVEEPAPEPEPVQEEPEKPKAKPAEKKKRRIAAKPPIEEPEVTIVDNSETAGETVEPLPDNPRERSHSFRSIRESVAIIFGIALASADSDIDSKLYHEYQEVQKARESSSGRAW